MDSRSGRGRFLQISWTKLPFAARNREEFSRGLTAWLGQVFYETLPAQGYEIREEQIYTTFRIAKALADGKTLFAEAGTGTGKTFAYLLPLVCYARFRGKPAVVASASGVLQAQLTSPDGDIQALSRVLGLDIDARLAFDPGEYICQVKVNQSYPGRRMKGWTTLRTWATRTKTGCRSEVPYASDEMWSQIGFEPTLPCDTCRHRGTCHMIAARRHYRAAGDLIVTDHRLFAHDLFTRAERQAAGELPLLPAFSAVVLDEGHHVPEIWQRTQGHVLTARRLAATLDLIGSGYGASSIRGGELAEARRGRREYMERVLVGNARRESQAFLAAVMASAAPGEGKRHAVREGAVFEAAGRLGAALAALQDELITEEAMMEGTSDEMAIRAWQSRLDDVHAALALFQSPEAVPWVEGEDLWVVPRVPVSLSGAERLPAGVPCVFSSATLEPAYAGQVLGLTGFEGARVGVPFNLAEQVLVYQPSLDDRDEVEQTLAVIRAMRGRTLVLLGSLAEVERYRRAMAAQAGAGLPGQVLFEGDAERGAMLEQFRADVSSVLVGATFWEGVDVPGESLSCVVVPRLPFPAHDPLIVERREQAAGRGEDSFLAVDLPEMLLKLKQGVGRLIRTTQDRGVIALLDRSYVKKPWAEAVEGVLPEGAEATGDLERVAQFC
ncbi:MAG: ATP-dependent helicase [Symbiobacteriaceae bacterium]|jgi:ATP-dependent DNA helicase DinG|nr:ATP-dependent helicase [Symbiobacteriaceae bacterium]